MMYVLRLLFSKKVWTYIFAILIVIFNFFPIYWMIVTGFRPFTHVFTRPPMLLPGPFSTQSLDVLLFHTDFLTYYKNSAIVATCTTIISISVASLSAYASTRFRFKGKGFLTKLTFLAYMFPPILLAIPLLGIMIFLRLYDTLASLVLAHIALVLPFAMWLLWGYFNTIPTDIEESALVDGATRLQALIKVVMPLALPGIVAVAIFSFILSWTDYVFALILIASDQNKTITIGLAAMQGAFDIRWGELMAGGTIITIPVLVGLSFISKYLIRGLAAGAVKG